jgi:hypothetical protein
MIIELDRAVVYGAVGESQSAPDRGSVAASVSQTIATGVGGEHGIAKLRNRKEISAGSDCDRSQYLHPHP